MTYATRHHALAAVFCILLVDHSGGATAQSLTREMVESRIKEVISAYDSNDVERIVKVDPGANGFGFRELNARPADTVSWSNGLKAFLTRADYYRMHLDEVHTNVDGNVGLAWGFYTEDFRLKGRSPEKLRVRTPMDVPIAADVIRAVESARGEAIKIPSMGATGPDAAGVVLGMPTINVPIANHDDNQHTFDENLRIQNLWDGIELMAALLTM